MNKFRAKFFSTKQRKVQPKIVFEENEPVVKSLNFESEQLEEVKMTLSLGKTQRVQSQFARMAGAPDIEAVFEAPKVSVLQQPMPPPPQ